jgi:hypothetical protein
MVAEEREAVARLASIRAHDAPVDLDAKIRVVHGHDEVANTDMGFEPAAKAFARWIESQE